MSTPVWGVVLLCLVQEMHFEVAPSAESKIDGGSRHAHMVAIVVGHTTISAMHLSHHRWASACRLRAVAWSPRALSTIAQYPPFPQLVDSEVAVVLHARVRHQLVEHARVRIGAMFIEDGAVRPVLWPSYHW